ncbi:MAG: DEAD/DEAH box helicase, partial [Candidatus Bathyarchaeia archaeon]
MKIEDINIPESAKRLLIETGFNDLYPPQKEAVKAGALDGKNLVLASPTASGKTLVAELCALKHVIEKGGKVLYLTPLRALASEKYEEFQKYTRLEKKSGERIKVAISTGDYDSADPHLARYDVVVCTNEKVDSLLRHRAHWMSDVSLVVADEVHLLNDMDRGPTLEVVLARLLQINPNAQFLALSATIRNAEEIAEWLKAESITTEWRPVKLMEGVYLHGEVEFRDGSSYKVEEAYKNPAINMAVHILKQGGQALIFAETRKASVELANKASLVVKNFLSKPEERSLKEVSTRILETGERTRISKLLAELITRGTAFHHAGLYGPHRKIIEDSFRAGKIKVVVATPTLAAGVNLPARLVVINSYERFEPGYGRYPIPVLEYKQMAGRAGRPKYDKIGEAILIARTPDEQEYLMESYICAQPERIWSKLAVERVLRSHVLATLASGFAHTELGLYDFFDKTFYAFQYDPKHIRGIVGRALKFLTDEEMVHFDRGNIVATEFGRRVSELYIDPESAVIIRDGLYNRAKMLTDISFLHM